MSSVIMMSVVMLDVIMLSTAVVSLLMQSSSYGCHYAECLYDEFRFEVMLSSGYMEQIFSLS